MRAHRAEALDVAGCRLDHDHRRIGEYNAALYGDLGDRNQRIALVLLYFLLSNFLSNLGLFRRGRLGLARGRLCCRRLFGGRSPAATRDQNATNRYQATAGDDLSAPHCFCHAVSVRQVSGVGSRGVSACRAAVREIPRCSCPWLPPPAPAFLRPRWCRPRIRPQARDR